MKIRSLCLLLFAAGMLPAPMRKIGPDEAMLDKGVRMLEKGKFESGRTTLESMIQTYPASRLLDEARDQIEASLLLEDAQQRIRSRRYGTAVVTLQTLISVYPESPLAAQARQAMQKAARLEEASEPVVRSIRFQDLPGANPAEVPDWFRQREVNLAEQSPYRPEELHRAQVALEDLLATRGQQGIRVVATVRDLPAHHVEIVFSRAR